MAGERKKITDDVACPCGSQSSYGSCCGPVHADGAGLGSTAEQLMRARYSAYVLHDGEFLLRSWHPDTRPATIGFDAEHIWRGLRIEATTGGGGLERTGTVEFRARFQHFGRNLELHELSRFERVGGSWLYVDGFDPDAGGAGRRQR